MKLTLISSLITLGLMVVPALPLAVQLAAQGSSITIGETNILTNADSGNANLLVAQQTTLSQTATIKSLSFYVPTAAGKLRLGIYDSSGPSGGPGAKKAETNEMTPVVGWNLGNVTTPVSLPAGTYWLAYLPSSNSLYFRNTSTGTARWYSYTYGPMPATFSTSTSSGAVHWSLYATLDTTQVAIFDFTLSNGGDKTVGRGSSVTSTATATLLSGTSQAVSYSASGLPAGVTASFSPTSCSPTCTTTITITAANFSAIRTSTVTVTGTAGATVHASTFSLTVTGTADATPPMVSVSAPANNAIVSGSSTVVSATASDNVGVAGVQFLLDGTNLGAEDTTSPYSVVWNTTTATSGSHLLSARARDAAGNTATATAVTVNVNNQGPTGSVVINGGAPATNSRNVTLTISATDTLSALTQMRFSNTGTFSTSQAYATTAAWTLSFGSGTRTVYGQVGDAAGNWSATFTDTIVVDTTPPTISGVSAGNVTNTSATVTWTTSEPATSLVDYGTSTAYGQATAIDNALVAAHSVTLTGLTANTAYNYRVRSIDAATNERIGSNNTFVTLTGPADSTPPSVPGNLVANPTSPTQINLTWTASTDNVGVTGYKVFRNGVQVNTSPTNAYTDTGLAVSTSYVYAVSAFDAAGNNSAQSATASGTTFPDTTPPTVAITSPANGSNVSATVAVAATVTDDVGVAGVLFQVDGANIAPEVLAPPYGVPLDTMFLADGGHGLTAIARDTSNNTTTSPSVSVVVNNTIQLPPATPTMIQHVSTASNEEIQAGNPFYISLPNLTGAGNVLILGVSYPFAASRTVTITDDKSNHWTLGQTTPLSPSSGQTVSSLYYALNVAAGTQKITVTFNALVFDFQAVVSEFYNVATVAAADGGSGSNIALAPSVTTGSFTTASPGDLVYSYAYNTSNSNAATTFTAGSGFTLLSADLQLGTVAQYSVQPSAGSINPTVTVTGGTNAFNAVGLALKAATAGTPPPPGIRIVHVYHVLYRSSRALQFPSTGNLLVCLTAYGTGDTVVSAMSTNPGNSWTKAPMDQPSFEAQIWYAANATTSPNLRITPTVSFPQITLNFFDVTGAAASPYDSAAGLPWSLASYPDNRDILGVPVIKPSTANGLIFAVLTNGAGPTTATIGAGLTLDTITYGNQVDHDFIDNADGYAHYYNPSTAAVSWGWKMNSSMPGESSLGVAIAFKGAGQ